MARRTLLLLVTLAASVLWFAPSASAHNTLLSSDPADGAVLSSPPAQLTLVFDKPVPLDTVSIELIDASGVRSDLSGFAHGPNGDTEVVTPLPALELGAVNLRWRLVGPDGHPLTGRIAFTIVAPETEPVSDTSVPVPTATESATAFRETWSTPGGMRWLLRFASYAAIMSIGGVLATIAFVWRDAWENPLIRRTVAWSLAITAVMAFAQLLVVASDIKGVPPWESLGGISAAFSTDSGVAFGIRIVLLAALGWAMFMAATQTDEAQWTLAAILLLLLLATWAFAGHSRSMRWPLIGVPLDVAHHAAAAAWIGGLAILGLVAIKECTINELILSVNRFAQLAKIAVTVIVVTGVLQAFRLVGSPGELFAGSHGRYLVLKVLVLGAMLKVADVNRQRVNRRLQSTTTASRRVVGNLRRAMGTELAVGVLIVAVTAAMVVSPPAIADNGTASDSELVAATTLPVTVVSTTTIETLPTCVLSGSPLQIGATGPDVECLQQALVASGFLTGEVNGTFDAATDAAVRSLQAQRGLLVDGIVGAVTASALGIWPTS